MEVEIVDEQILELHQHVDDDQSVKVRMTIVGPSGVLAPAQQSGH